MSSGPDETMCEWLEMYALYGLEVHEKVAFEYHLTQCALCRNQLTELKQVVDLLPMASDPASIPEGMRDRVLGSILGQTAVERPGAMSEFGVENETPGRRAAQGRKAAQIDRNAVKEVSNLTELSRRAVQTERYARRSAYWRWANAGLAIMFIGMGVYVFQLNERVGKLQTELQVTNEELTKAESELSKAALDLIAVNKPAEALKVNRVVRLSSAAENFVSKGLAISVMDATGAHLIVQAEDLPPINQNEVFQLWLIKDNQPVNAGTFYSLDGIGTIYCALEPKDYDSVAVTLEPDAHSEKPRGTLVLSAGLKN